MRFPFSFGHRDIKKAISLTLCGWCCFSLMYLVARWIGPESNVTTMVFFRNIVGLVAITPFILFNLPKSLEVKNVKAILIRSFSGLGNLVFLFLALQKINLVNATLLNNTAPFFVPFFLSFFLKSSVEKKVWPAVIIGFIGVALILRPDAKILNLGAIYGILSGICLAITMITLKSVAHAASMITYLFYFFFIGLMATAPFALIEWKVPSIAIFLALLSIGLFSSLGQLFVYFGMKRGKPEQLAPISYSTIIFAGFFDWILWSEIPALIAFFGMALIIAAGLWIAFVSKPPTEEI